MRNHFFKRTIQKLRKEYYLRRFRKIFAQTEGPIKLNIGCGTDYKPG